jgi:hypothetical protein
VWRYGAAHRAATARRTRRRLRSNADVLFCSAGDEVRIGYDENRHSSSISSAPSPRTPIWALWVGRSGVIQNIHERNDTRLDHMNQLRRITGAPDVPGEEAVSTSMLPVSDVRAQARRRCRRISGLDMLEAQS